MQPNAFNQSQPKPITAFHPLILLPSFKADLPLFDPFFSDPALTVPFSGADFCKRLDGYSWENGAAGLLTRCRHDAAAAALRQRIAPSDLAARKVALAMPHAMRLL